MRRHGADEHGGARPVLCALFVIGSIVGCGKSTTPHAPPAAEIKGAVTASPTCPVERQGHPCPPVPVAGTIEARDRAGQLVASGPLGTDGSYALSLSPGTYTLHVSVPAVLPRCPDTPVTVTDGEVTHTDIGCDSGIR